MRFGLRELIFFAVLLAVPVAAYFYVFTPHNTEMELSKQRIEDMKGRLELVRSIDEDREQLEAQLEIGAHNLHIISSQLPSEQSVHEILKEITTFAEDHRLSVKRFEVERSLPAAAYRERPIRMEVSGPFDSFYEFLTKIETMPRITRLHDLRLKRYTSRTTNPANDLPDGWLEGTLLLSIYYRPPVLQVAEVATN